MNKLTHEKRGQILSVLCEGMGANAASRIMGASKNIVFKLLADAGEACATYQDDKMRNLTCNRVECDEIWSFVVMKKKYVPEQHKGEFGFVDVYTWTAIDADINEFQNEPLPAPHRRVDCNGAYSAGSTTFFPSLTWTSCLFGIVIACDLPWYARDLTRTVLRRSLLSGLRNRR
jgi:hypothetical protein